MIQSMTAFATAKGGHAGQSWVWEMRSVNGKGLDLRLRLPEGIDGLEAGLRAALDRTLARGNVSLTLKLQSTAPVGARNLNSAVLDAVLQAMAEVESRAMEVGVSLAPATAADVLGLPGVLENREGGDDAGDLGRVLLADFESVLESFIAMRQSEGAALAMVLSAQVNEIARLTDEARALLDSRSAEIARSHRAALSRVIETAADVDSGRVAQELALLAVKLDVTEELDRLRAHVAAARALLAKGSPMGRKLDFLTQEFNREANTLCSKAQHPGLTMVGLALKAVIDQMREQVQNVE
ncbi:MAG: YicC family protein [Rhodobacteraceae bacterium CG17_big_fil_post_rev_8_21_14_2_50_63_15]|nr:YicC family protein [Roseovarius sp.]PIV79891.1 MAG: YicC family protein [Rhodobacteraceae bacterium CG17_big_fil_post_rev_8_21_14_2_50_63_15]